VKPKGQKKLRSFSGKSLSCNYYAIASVCANLRRVKLLLYYEHREPLFVFHETSNFVVNKIVIIFYCSSNFNRFNNNAPQRLSNSTYIHS
jgi:hypothetical protein